MVTRSATARFHLAVYRLVTLYSVTVLALPLAGQLLPEAQTDRLCRKHTVLPGLQFGRRGGRPARLLAMSSCTDTAPSRMQRHHPLCRWLTNPSPLSQYRLRPRLGDRWTGIPASFREVLLQASSSHRRSPLSSLSPVSPPPEPVFYVMPSPWRQLAQQSWCRVLLQWEHDRSPHSGNSKGASLRVVPGWDPCQTAKPMEASCVRQTARLDSP